MYKYIVRVAARKTGTAFSSGVETQVHPHTDRQTDSQPYSTWTFAPPLIIADCQLNASNVSGFSWVAPVQGFLNGLKMRRQWRYEKVMKSLSSIQVLDFCVCLWEGKGPGLMSHLCVTCHLYTGPEALPCKQEQVNEVVVFFLDIKQPIVRRQWAKKQKSSSNLHSKKKRLASTKNSFHQSFLVMTA